MKELLSGLIGPVTGIINKVVPDKDEAARLAHETFITVECIPVRVKAFVRYTRHDLIFFGGVLGEISGWRHLLSLTRSKFTLR